MEHHCPGVPFLLLGTKIDLRDDPATLQMIRDRDRSSPISAKQGMQKAKEIGAVKYVECSALTQKGLKEVFEEAVRAVIAPKPTAVKKKKGCEIL